MPEAIPVETPDELDNFTRAYLECAAWASTHTYVDDDGNELETVSIDDVMNDDGAEWAPETIAQAAADCHDFQEANADLLAQAGSAEQNGHDFWLTRNGHGAGFWDRGYPGTLGDDLSKAAKAYGECDLYLGGDGKVYCS